MKTMKYMAVLAAAATLLLTASCKKETPSELPAGKTDTEYIDDVLSTAISKVNISDFTPLLNCYTDLISPVMNDQNTLGAQKWISDLLKEIADDKTTEFSASRFSKVLRFEDRDSYAEDSETDNTLEVIFERGKDKAVFTLQWGEETFDATVTINKSSALRLADKVMETKAGGDGQDGGVESDPRFKQVTFKFPKQFTLQSDYNGTPLIAGTLNINPSQAMMIGRNGPLSDFHAVIDLMLSAFDYQLKGSGAPAPSCRRDSRRA